MAQNSVRATLILRNDLAATWASRNPILAQGELGAEIDTGLLKIGDGLKHFNELGYINLGKAGDGALITTNSSNQFTIAGYGHSYWVYDQDSFQDIEVVEEDLSKWPATLELEIKNHVARWVVPKINYDRTQGKIDGALITLSRDPMYSAEASTKNYVDNAIANAIINAPHLKRQVVTTLPAAANADANTIYMILDNESPGPDKYREYMLLNSQLVQIGDTSADLTNYLQKPAAGNFTEGHIPVFASDGAIIDSGVAASTINQVPLATSTVPGIVYSSSLDNKISVDNLGIMEVNRVATDKLYVPNGSEFILNGGTA